MDGGDEQWVSSGEVYDWMVTNGSHLVRLMMGWWG